MFEYIQNSLNLFGKKSEITLCVPAYNSSSFIMETLDAIRNQTYEDFRCVISVDLSDDDTYYKISSSLKDRRFKVFRQKIRLGWTKNVNFVLRESKTKYVCILPHDDIIDRTYIQRLLKIIKENDEIAAVFSDIVQFGAGKEAVIKQPSVVGSKLDRILEYLNHHYNCVVFRGIINREKVGQDIYCSSNEYDDFSEDTIWGLKLALHGPLIRHPEVLYRKRYLDTSYHHKWQQWNESRNLSVWAFHCAKCLHILMKDRQLAKNRSEISQAIVNRLLQSKTNLWRRPELQAKLITQVMTPRLLSELIGGHE